MDICNKQLRSVEKIRPESDKNVAHILDSILMLNSHRETRGSNTHGQLTNQRVRYSKVKTPC